MMMRYKDCNCDQTKMLPISFDRQILSGIFEYSLSCLIDTELDLSAFEQHYNDDENDRPAYDPRLLLKIVILAYSKSIISSRKIERLCRENIIFMTPSADAQPHCLRSEKQETPRQANVKLDVTAEQKAGVIERMKHKIDSAFGRHVYSQRLGTVEPVFGHLAEAIGIKRFSRRCRKKVDGQWKLMMMMLHNILKIHRYGWEWA